MTKVWCVAYKDDKGHEQWCATKDNAEPSKDAWNDDTECDHVIIGRYGSDKRAPTCIECITALATKPAKKRATTKATSQPRATVPKKKDTPQPVRKKPAAKRRAGGAR